MSDLDNGDHYILHQNPDSNTGAALWELSNHGRAQPMGSVIGIGWLVAFGWLAIYFSEMWYVAGAFAVFAFVGMFIAFEVSEMATDIRCPECGFRQDGYNVYCSSCGVEFDHENPRP